LESRLPSDLFLKAPFIYSGPDFLSFPLGMISDLVEFRGKSIQRFCPFTVSKSLSNGSLKDQMFCFAFFYLKDSGDLTLFLTQPYWIDGSNLQESFDFFLAGVEEHTRYAGGGSIELEIHDRIVPPVSFPTSLSDFSYDLNSFRLQEIDPHVLRERGFQEARTLLCYDSAIDEVQRVMDQRLGLKEAFTAREMDQSQFLTVDGETREFPVREFCLSLRDPAVARRMIHFFSDTGSVAYKRGAVFFGGSVEGFLHWSPDLFEPFREKPSPFLFLFYEHLARYRFKCGKIVRWRMRRENDELFSSMLFQGLRSMRQRGLERCQIAFVDSQQRFLNSMFEFYGFRIAQATRVLRKKL